MFKALETIPLFNDVDESILQLLEPLFEPYACAASTVIFEQGDPAQDWINAEEELAPGWQR